MNINNHSIKILVIDDEASVRQSLRYQLEDLNYQVLTAEDGLQGIQMADRERPQLVLTDLRMPRKDGLEVLRYCRERRFVDVSLGYGVRRSLRCRSCD
ncbi:MAG: response regulator [Chromatiaceae bacterium]|nr:response regulator [Chromatiaceae bacterium]